MAKEIDLGSVVGPQGPKGDTGAQGPKGDTGAAGPAGAQGPAGTAATVKVGTVTTGEAGSNAAVTNSGTSSDAVLNFTIPRGPQGPKGDAGATGPAGADGKTPTFELRDGNLWVIYPD